VDHGAAADAAALGDQAARHLQTRRVETGRRQSRELPLEWQLALVQENRSWRIRPLYDEQWMDTRFPYWEGVVLVEDEQGNASGVGYMELTGYE